MTNYPLAYSEDVLNKSVDRYTDKEFPAYRFVPGLHPHPVYSPEGHSYGLDEEEVSKWKSDVWRLNEDYLYGIDLYNYHFYWEAHEAWEALWLASVNRSSEHMFIQGLIKMGAALLKIRMASYQIQDLIGARTLSKSGMDLMSKVGLSNFMGLDIESYLASYSSFISPILEDEIPTIDQNTPRLILDF